MNEALTILQETALRPTAWALVHFLWQGALVALAVAGALKLLPAANARGRYAVACAGLGLMILLPVVLLLAPFSHLLAAVAVLSHLAGVAVSRWLFFAEAEHVVGLYYGRR